MTSDVRMTKKISEMTPAEAEAKRKYQREWARKKHPGKKRLAAAAAAAAAGKAGGIKNNLQGDGVAPAAGNNRVLQIAPLYNGDNPGEALFYISDSLQVMNNHLKRIVEACEKAQGL